mgnify:CR=1 FL=1
MVEIEKYSKYEVARMIGSRALQLSMGAPMLVKLSEKDLEGLKYNVREIAKREFAEGVLPITVRRPLPRTRKKEVGKVEAKTTE